MQSILSKSGSPILANAEPAILYFGTPVVLISTRTVINEVLARKHNMPSQDECWAAVLRKDKAFDGKFFFGVSTTGVFCRPSCPARSPLRKNVRFFKNVGDAENAGMRACRRCNPLLTEPDDPQSARIRELCDYIRNHNDKPLNLKELGQKVGISPYHLQRTFKAMVGLSPRQYAEACRMDTFKKHLRKTKSITESIYEAGFGSQSRIYERIDNRLGMKPTDYQACGRGVEISYVVAPTLLGLMMMAATDRGLCFVQFGENSEEMLKNLYTEYPKASLQKMKEPYPEQFHTWMEALCHYLEGTQQSPDLPIDVKATAFTYRVWAYLMSIPFGEVQSYSEVASGIGMPSAVRAVARACAANRVAIVIPCHRVIRASGEIGGYRWGPDRKRALIDLERSVKASGGA